MAAQRGEGGREGGGEEEGEGGEEEGEFEEGFQWKAWKSGED